MLKKSLIISLALIVPLLFFMGCAEDESAVAPGKDLSVILLAGPQGEVPFNAYVTYKWQAKGGSGNYTGYDYTFTRNGSPVDAGTGVLINSVTFTDLQPGNYTFSLSVTDTDNKSASISRDITVVTSEAVPVVSITQSPLAGGELTENSAATFNWEGDDPDAYFGIVTGYTMNLMRDDTVAVLNVTTPVQVTSITIDSLAVGSYKFTVIAHNNAGLVAEDAVSFIVRLPNLIWIDDHYLGSIPAEFAERQERVETFDGYAWMEYDRHDGDDIYVDLNVILNDPASEAEVAIWDADGLGTSALYWFTGGYYAYDDLALVTFLDNGGNMIFIGSDVNDWAWENLPPATGDFDNKYMGLADSELEVIESDTTEEWVVVDGKEVLVRTVTFDTTYYNPWDYSDYVTLSGANGYSDISIDIGKDPGTHQNSSVYYKFAGEVKEITTDDAMELPAGYVYDFGAGKVVVLGYNLYYSPTAQYKDVIQKIMKDEFGL